MKNKFIYALIGIVVASLSFVFGGACMAEATPGAAGGVIDPGGTNTVAFAKENDPDLRLNHVERKVVKVFPHATPLTTLAFYCKTINSDSQIVEYRTASTLPQRSKTKTNIRASAKSSQLELDTENNNIFVKNETILFPKIKGFNGTTASNESLMAIVVDVASNGKPVIKPVNGKMDSGSMIFPDIPVGTLIVRSARAHNELDIQTSPFASVPTKDTQFLQKMAAQIEQSTLDKINENSSESDWSFSDMEELAIYDMKRSQNVAFLFGAKGKTFVGKDEVLTTGGIYYTPSKDFVYGKGGADRSWSTADIVDLHKMAFTGVNGSGKKIMFSGSTLLANIMKARMPEGYTANANMYERFNLSFSELKSDFGTILVVLDETFDDMGMDDCGLIIDPDFLRKYTINGIGTVDLDLKKGGQKDADARVIREISGLVLQNPNAHVRVSPKP